MIARMACAALEMVRAVATACVASAEAVACISCAAALQRLRLHPPRFFSRGGGISACEHVDEDRQCSNKRFRDLKSVLHVGHVDIAIVAPQRCCCCRRQQMMLCFLSRGVGTSLSAWLRVLAMRMRGGVTARARSAALRSNHMDGQRAGHTRPSGGVLPHSYRYSSNSFPKTADIGSYKS